MLQTILPRLLGHVPVSWRRAIIGQASDPSSVSTYLHKLLNLFSPGESRVFICFGPLEGYRMCIDWTRFRSFVYGTWEPEVVRAITSTIKPGMSIVDIGAHIGFYTLLFAKYAGPHGHVVSFEPSPASFSALQRNVEINALQNVRLVPEAVYSRRQEITINVPDDEHNSGDASIRCMERSKPVQVKATTLDCFCSSSGFQPDFMKMDVEGAEYDVLIGAQWVIAQFRPAMLIELHHFDGNVGAHQVPMLLAQWGYHIQWLDQSEMTSHILASPGPLRPRIIHSHEKR